MFDMFQNISPAFVLIFAGILSALVPSKSNAVLNAAGKNDISHLLRKILIIGAPIVAALFIFNAIDPGTFRNVPSPTPGYDMGPLRGQFSVAGLDLTTFRLDRLSLIWGFIFCLAGVINGIFGLHERCKITDSTALLYTGAGVGAVFAGDLITLFLFWELTAISSVFLVWRGGETSYASGMRYLAMHVLSGVLLLSGAVMYGRYAGNYDFNHIGIDVPGGKLMLLAMGIKAGFPLLHNWIQDAYPKSSVTGTVILSVFTTKLAIYALARGYAGTESLIYIGAVMTAFPVFFAVLENDLRKVLSYSLNNQLGFMVCGIGIGSGLAMNGVMAQVVIHILMKGLLFMSMGAVLHRTGTIKASELGGLFKSMPLTALFCLIGAGSISAFPLLGAFVSKSMIIAAVFEEHHMITFMVLLFASAGVMEHSGIKVPYFTFFSHDSGKRPKEAPWNMLMAMGISAFLCIALAFPFGGYQMLFSLLPNAVEYHPYTGNHVVQQLQLLFAAMFAFALLKRIGLYPPERRAQILDFDWTYRRLGLGVLKWFNVMGARLETYIGRVVKRSSKRAGNQLYQMFSPAGSFSQDTPSGMASLLTAAILAIALGLAYFVR